jgi:hypothetical protein
MSQATVPAEEMGHRGFLWLWQHEHAAMGVVLKVQVLLLADLLLV